MPSWATVRFVVFLALLAVAGGAVHSCRNAQAEARVARIERDSVLVLNDSTQARLMTEQLEHEKFVGVLKANQELQGRLIAGIRLRVPARDTIVVHDTLPTTTMADSTRIASFRDSTFAGVIEGKVTAPPCCAPLSLKFGVHRPEFSPSVSISEVGQRHVAVVVWQGERAEVEAAYTNIPRSPRRFSAFTEVKVNDLKEWSASGGLQARAFWSLTGFAQASQRFGIGESPMRLETGLRKTW